MEDYYERNEREVYLIVTTYHLFEDIEDDIDYQTALDIMAFYWAKIKSGELEHPRRC